MMDKTNTIKINVKNSGKVFQNKKLNSEFIKAEVLYL